MGKKTKISTFDSTWSPIVGCRNGCKYCYARRIVKRFSGFKDNDLYYGESWRNVQDNENPLYELTDSQCRKTKSGDYVSAPYPFGFEPTFHRYKLDEPQKWKEPKDVFVCSMADLFAEYIPDNWIEDIFEACEQAPWHRFFFLTKNPIRYKELFEERLMPKNLKNKWFGTTITKPDTPFFYLDAKTATDNDYKYDDFNGYLSIEPIQADFPVIADLKALGIKWVIVGAETGNRVGKVKPEQIWIRHIAEATARSRVPMFMKESLHELMGSMFLQEKP